MSLFQRLKPFVAPFLRRVIGEDHVEVDIIQPEEQERVSPVVILPNMFERITAAHGPTQLSQQIESARATIVTHAPVLRFVYRNALVWRSGYSNWTKSERYGNEWAAIISPKSVVEFHQLRYCNSYVSSRFFGHWLTDAVPSALLEPGTGDPWLPADPSWTDTPNYLKILNLPQVRDSLVHAEQLIVYEDFSQGSSKRARYRKIKDEIHARTGVQHASDYVYLQRGLTGSPRKIKNERQFIEQLSKRHWKIIDLSEVSFDLLQRSLCQARVVMSVEGSHLTHAQLSMYPATSIIMLVPHDCFTSVHAGYARANNIAIGMIVMNGSQRDGYHIDLDEALRTVQEVENSVMDHVH